MDIEELIKITKSKYPESRAIDYIKIIYQSIFGGSHLIKNKNSSFLALKQEYENITNKDNDNLYDELLNGVIRINLDSIKKYNISLELLNEIFYLSSISIKGDTILFDENVNELRELIKNGVLEIDIKEYDQVVDSIKNSSYSPVSHSERYHELYNPHYRVILKRYLLEYLNKNKEN